MRHLRVAALLAAAFTLAACAGVPTSGPIQQGPVLVPAGEDQFIRVIARPPHAGMTPEEVVRGFQIATASPDALYAVAREFLTPAGSLTWDPTLGVEISDSAPLTPTTRDSVVTMSGGLSGTIGASGEYAVAAPGSKFSVRYTMERVEGEWRISSAPDGLVLSPSDIERGFRTFNLYFFTRDFTMLVPAPVTVPVSDAGLATQLVRGLLAGPTPWIASAVRSAFPAGTQLALDSVPVVDGVADVALTAEVLADDTTRQKLSAQIVWTLRQLPDITGVSMSVNGVPVSVPGVGVVQPINSWPLVDPNALADAARAYAVDKRGLVRIDLDGSATFVAHVKPDLILPGISLDSTRVAGISADGRSLWDLKLADGATATRPVYSGASLSRPSWDRSGTIWVVDRGTGLVAVRDGKATPMPIAELPTGMSQKDIRAVAVSRDGTRMALLVQRDGRVEPMVARIESFGDTVRVAGPRRVEGAITDAEDLAWLDADTLAVLGTSGASALQVLQIDVGSARVRSGDAPEKASTLAAAPGRSILIGAGKQVYKTSGGSRTLLTQATYPVYPG